MVRRVLRFARSHRGTRYPSPYDGQPPRYTGPTWIGKPIGAHPMPEHRTADWIGKRIHVSMFPESDKIGA